MASLPNTKLVTYEEWLEMPEAKDEEVVNGEIRIMPMAKAQHARIITRLHNSLTAQLDPLRFELLSSSFGIVISVSPLTCRNPDLAVFDLATASEVDGYFRPAPELAIEVLSVRNTPKDIRLKIAEYSRAEFPELWVLSQENRSVEVLLLQDGRLQRKALLTEGLVQPSRLPRVAVDVAAIWPE